MPRNHLKRINAPPSWPIKRKTTKWITRPTPGPHPLAQAMPLTFVLREMLGVAKTLHEVKSILHGKKVLVNKTVRTDRKFPIGLMDVLEIPDLEQAYRVVLTPRGKFTLIPVEKAEAKVKPCRIAGKTILAGKKVQLNLSDGRTLLVDKDAYKVNDTLLIDLEKWNTEKTKAKAITKHLKLEEGARIYLTDGTHVGTVGTVDSITPAFPTPFVTVTAKDARFETPKRFAFVIDPSLTLGEVAP